MIILPRQAWDKHRKSTQKEMRFFLKGDYKTTIAAYKTNMAKFDASNHPFIAIKPVRSRSFLSTFHTKSDHFPKTGSFHVHR